MKSIREALENLAENIGRRNQRTAIGFDAFLERVVANPQHLMRNIFQLFHDMICYYVGEGVDEYPDDPESIHFVCYDCERLFVQGADRPFFADRIFANRLVNLSRSMESSAQQNKIYIFEGPPGCGKSTFLNNLLMKFEQYANSEEGLRYETVWRLDRSVLGTGAGFGEVMPLAERLARALDPAGAQEDLAPDRPDICRLSDRILEIPCPSHDHPILMIPKEYRRAFLDDLFENSEFKWHLSDDKEYEWVFRDDACTICRSLYDALLSRVKEPHDLFKMIFARPYAFSRRLGEGISVFNPGDRPLKRPVMGNPMLQRSINAVLNDSNLVKYVFSEYAKTNDGVYALMDIKSHNTERLIELHNIISEGVHKVEDIEENVKSLLLAVMNPEDKRNIEVFQSFSDRIEYITIPYVMDMKTEVEIYRNIFGQHIEESFLPRVLRNFARVIISTRLNPRSAALTEWIPEPQRYRLYCDRDLLLLKMEIYTGVIPTWLTEEDRKRLTAKRRRRILAESEAEGKKGISGRDSIKLFNKFFSTYNREDKLIDMSDLFQFFDRYVVEHKRVIPEGFLESLQRMYDYTVLQEVKESLYFYNEEQISRDVRNYMFAVNFEIGSVETSRFTGDKLEITEEFLSSLETRLIGAGAGDRKRQDFRRDVQREYTSQTLPQEILIEGRDVTETHLYQSLYERYVYNLKEKVLDPFLDNENFRRAIKDYGREDFKTYDKRIRGDVEFLIGNLMKKYHYSQQGAKEVCIYVIDKKLADKFAAAG